MYTLIIIALTALISIYGFNNRYFFNKNAFMPANIYQNNEWYRFFTAGFLHADYMHLIFNMFVLYSFGSSLESYCSQLFGGGGKLIFLFLYISAIGVAHSTTYFKNRNNNAYLSIGASGAVAAVLYACIFLNPGGQVAVYGIPMNSLLFGIIYLGLEYFLSKRNGDRVNHDAHFMGALYGFVFMILFKPSLVFSFIAQVKVLIGIYN
jgi:membrane associated rhomboid family serine protease